MAEQPGVTHWPIVRPALASNSANKAGTLPAIVPQDQARAVEPELA
jgi:hypothetical protein